MASLPAAPMPILSPVSDYPLRNPLLVQAFTAVMKSRGKRSNTRPSAIGG